MTFLIDSSTLIHYWIVNKSIVFAYLLYGILEKCSCKTNQLSLEPTINKFFSINICLNYIICILYIFFLFVSLYPLSNVKLWHHSDNFMLQFVMFFIHFHQLPPYTSTCLSLLFFWIHSYHKTLTFKTTLFLFCLFVDKNPQRFPLEFWPSVPVKYLFL